MCRLLGTITAVAVCAALFCFAGRASAQETPSAKATRKRLEEKISVEFDNTRTKDAFDEIRNELNGRVSFKIDNASGVSNNSKVSFKAKEQTAKKVLDGLCDKLECGWYVISKSGDRYDGWIMIRKSKERGYEEGKEPKGAAKQSSSLERPRGNQIAECRLQIADLFWESAICNLHSAIVPAGRRQ